VLEGVALAVRHNLDAIAAAGAPYSRIVGVSGGTQSGVLPQIVTDVLGLPQSICPPDVGASYGSAILAARAAGWESSSWAKAELVLEPNAASKGVYDDLYARYLSLYPATADAMHGLAGLGR
jgi:xylulokinase